MRFEAKHAYFKKLVRVINNFKSLLSTLAERHQLFQAYLSLTGNVRDGSYKFSKTTEIFVDSISENIRDLITDAGFTFDRAIHECRKVTDRGICYYVGMIVVLGFGDCNDVLFGKIVTIYIQDLEYRFLLRLCNSEWDPHFSAYQVTLTGQFKLVKRSQLHDFYPLSIYEKIGKKYVVVKNFIFNHTEFSQI
jgi:hypothetical protein